MIVHDVYLVCDGKGCEEKVFLKKFPHKRQIAVRELRKMAEPLGWVTKIVAGSEMSFCPKHKGEYVNGHE